MKSTSKVLVHIGAEDGRSALLALAAHHPELIAEIEQIVLENAAATTFQHVADRVVAALAELTMFDLGRRDSADPLGYRDETQTAWEVVTETIRPFVEAIHRQAKMGMTAAAVVNCEGTLLGLYRADREQASELLEWIPDALSELAVEPLRARLSKDARTSAWARCPFAFARATQRSRRRLHSAIHALVPLDSSVQFLESTLKVSK